MPQVYIKGQAADAKLEARLHFAFQELCSVLRLTPPAAACSLDIVVDDSVAAGKLSVATAGSSVEAAVLWPNDACQPCVWPERLQLKSLTVGASLGGVARDASLLAFLLAQHLAVELRETSGSAGRRLALPAHQAALLPSDALCCALRGAAYLPAGAAGDTNDDSDDEDAMVTAAGRLSGRQLALLAWHAAPRFALRAVASLQDDRQLRALLSDGVLGHLRAAAAAALPAASVSSTGAMAEAAGAVVASLLQHPLLAAAGGAAGGRRGVRHLAPLLSPLAAAACQSVAESCTQRSAPPAGGGTPYQASHWRYSRPQERARNAAAHACVDWLYPALAAIAEWEAALLQPQAAPASLAALPQVRRLQISACFGIYPFFCL